MMGARKAVTSLIGKTLIDVRDASSDQKSRLNAGTLQKKGKKLVVFESSEYCRYVP